MGILSFFRRTKTAAEPRQGKTESRSGISVPGREHRQTPSDAASRAGGPAALWDASILVEPRVTEKTTRGQADGKYAFRVIAAATKHDIRRAVEQRFGVHVTGVRVMNVRGKERRRGQIKGRTAGHRKALVTLRTGERIELVGAGT